MSFVSVGLGGTQTISQSETDDVGFAGLGTLNIAGQAGSPIDVTLSQVGGVGLLDTINITNANVMLNGIAGVNALVNYNIGSGGTLDFGSTAGISAGTTIGFTAPNSRLGLANGVNLNLLGGISGFAPGSTIDVSGQATSLTYADNPGTNSGGTLRLLGSNGLPVATLNLLTGEYVPAKFQLASDGAGGTLVSFDTTAPTVTGVTTLPGSGTVGPGQTVAIDGTISEPVSVTGGVPTLTLSDGGTAVFDPTDSTPGNLVFTHTVQPGQTTPDLAVLGVNLNGATVTDAAGNPANLSGLITNPAGTLTITGATNGNGTGGNGGGTGGGMDGVYRFFDASTGTHFFTADANEKNALNNPNSPGYRSDLKEETNTFGAVDPAAADPNAVTVYRFFDTTHGTHFFTASQTEQAALTNPASSSYRPDLVYEANSSFKEHGTPQAGDVPVYRFFDTHYGTHFYTGDQTEYAAITTPGTPSFRPDLVSEGVGFYAPTGSYT